METKQMIECPACKGAKTQTINAQMFTSKGWEKQPPVVITCIHCNGTGEVDSVKQKMLEEIEKDFWCKCKNRNESHYVDDDEDERLSKHHWRCNHCDKVTQIG